MLLPNVVVLLCYGHACSGDYQTHDFSDFEDSDDGGRDRRSEAKGGSSVVRKAGGKRLKECPGCSAMLPLPTKECDYCDYVFTSRSMLSTAQNAVVESQNIRDIFPFEPERVSVNKILLYSVER